jgi:hypothetical protein
MGTPTLRSGIDAEKIHRNACANNINTRREGDSWDFNTKRQLPPRFGGDMNLVVIALRLVLQLK